MSDQQVFSLLLSSRKSQYSAKLASVSKQFEVSKKDVFAEVCRANVSFDCIDVAQLERKRDALDQRSEDLGRSFVDGKVEMSAFVQEYLEVRSNYHSLSSKMAVANQL